MSSVVAPSSLDRLWAAFRALVRAELPTLTFYGCYEYAIQAVHGSTPSCTVDCTPTDTTQPLPPLTNITMRSAVDGGTSQPTVGNRCLVMFVNGDPSRPTIVGADGNAQIVSLDATQTLNLGASAPTTNVGAAGAVNLGATPAALTKAAPVQAAFSTIATAMTTAGGAMTTASGLTGNYSIDVLVITAGFLAAGTAFKAIGGALSTAIAALPTTTVKGGP